MIKAASVTFETPLILDPEHPMLLIEENPAEFRRIVAALDAQFNGGDDEFVFTEDGGRIKAAVRGAFVRDCLGLDMSDKKITSAIFKAAERSFNDGEYLTELNRINAEVCRFIGDITYDFPYAVEYDEGNLADYLKLVGLRAAENYESYPERLICFTNLMSGLRFSDFMVFVNLKSYMTDEELTKYYAHCASEKISLLLLESHKARKLLPCERAVIITEDLCEITENID